MILLRCLRQRSLQLQLYLQLLQFDDHRRRDGVPGHAGLEVSDAGLQFSDTGGGVLVHYAVIRNDVLISAAWLSIADAEQYLVWESSIARSTALASTPTPWTTYSRWIWV